MADIANFGRITALALADSVNPCAIAVLTMILLTILTKNPEKKRKVLYSGLAFVFSVFVGYLVYGLIIIQFFQVFAEFLRGNSTIIYNGLATIAIVIGLLHVKDFFSYQRGGIATEMPMSLRPKVKKIINRITSPSGAFIIGFVITLFLLPCTMGPYVVASGLLSELPLTTAILWLIYYNTLFVLPMLAITLLIYLGISNIEDIQNWKKKNIKILHLIAGILLILVGAGIILGWI